MSILPLNFKPRSSDYEFVYPGVRRSADGIRFFAATKFGFDKMRVVPSLGDWVAAYRVHRRFASRQGAQYIATRRALAYLSAVVRKHLPEVVLEFGTGIGTITYLLLSTSPKLNVVSIEASPFCLEQLERNIPKDFKPRLTIFTLTDAPLDRRFDLIVIDGKLPPTKTYAFLRHGTIVFLEGNRKVISAKLMQVARAKNLVLDLEKQSFGSFRMRWLKTRLGFSRPVYAPRKTCRIGALRAAIPIANEGTTPHPTDGSRKGG